MSWIWSAALLALPSVRAAAPELQVAIDSRGDTLHLRASALPGQYFQLEQSTEVAFLEPEVVRMSLAESAIQWNLPMVNEGGRFYRLRAVGVQAPEDRDRDGLDDVLELLRPTFLDPLNPDDAGQDPDGDGLSTREELLRWNTDPREIDTDGDGWSDAAEVSAESNPTRADQRPETVVVAGAEIQITPRATVAAQPVVSVDVTLQSVGFRPVPGAPTMEIYPIQTRVPNPSNR